MLLLLRLIFVEWILSQLPNGVVVPLGQRFAALKGGIALSLGAPLVHHRDIHTTPGRQEGG